MPESPTPGSEDKTPEAPAPEMLQPHADTDTSAPEEVTTTSADGKDGKGAKARHITYRPSHKATFIGLAVVVAVLAINAGVVFYLMTRQSGDNTDNTQRQTVTLSTETLSKLGVNRAPVGDLGTELIVGPDARFNGKVTVGNDLNISGQLHLNNKLSAADASFPKLQAGTTNINELSVNGDGTMSSLTLRNNLTVVGTSRLQGATTITSNLNVTGSLTVAGALFAGSFQADNLISGTTFTIGGHVIVRGLAPSVSAGSAVGSNGTVSISGTDAAGTIAVNAGAGSGNGVFVDVVFHSPYESSPHIVVTAIGRSAGSFYINRTSTGFSIVVGALGPGGYAFDYVVMQ